jgi:hypothetical protein
MKTLATFGLVTLIAAPTFIQSVAAAPLLRRDSDQSGRIYGGAYNSRPDLTQSGPIHRGPVYRGYALSDWYL